MALSSKCKNYPLYAWRDNRIRLKATQGEGGIKIAQFTLLDDNGAINLSSATSVTFDGIKRNGQGCCINCEIVDAANGIIEFVEQTGITDIDGNVNGTINVVSADGNIKFDGIILYVAPNNTTKLIEASQAFSAFVEALNKLALITPEGTIAIDDVLTDDGVNAVQGKVIKAAINSKADKETIYTKTEIDKAINFEESSVATAIAVTMQSDSYCTKTGKVVSNTAFTCTDKIALADYNALSITSAYGYQAPLVVFYDENDNVLSYKFINESGVVKVTDKTVDIPTGAASAIINHANNTPAISVSGVKKEIVTIKNKLSELIAELSPLKGKSIYVDGDSIANGAGSNNYSFGEFLRDKYGMELTKGAVNGATLLVDDTHTNSIYRRITQLTGDYDYIIFDGGINDVSQGLPLGSKTSHYKGGYDVTTTLGALEQICYYLTINYFAAKKLFVIVHKILTVDAPVVPTKERDMFDAIKDVLNKWGIPYVDIYNDTNLGAFNNDINNTYFKLNSSGVGDRVHPTKIAYETFYMPLIEAKIKTL